MLSKFIAIQALIIFSMCADDICSQNVSSKIITDRPDITESSFTVPKKCMQIESGFSYTQNKFEGATEKYLVTPVVLIRYGITEKIELRLGAEVRTIKSESYDFTDTNVEGLAIAGKFKISDQEKILPSIALIAGSAIPVINSGTINDLIDPSLTFCLSNEVSEKFSIGYNLGFDLNDGFTSSASSLYSFSINYSLINSVGIFIEAYGIVPFSSSNAENFVDGGFTVLTSDNVQFDFSAGYVLNSKFDEYYVSSGASFKIPF